MNWPTPQDYNEAIQNPASNFAEDLLKSGRVALNPLGLPRAITGAFASVYRISSNGEDWAVRCFLTDRAEQKDRYLKISEYVRTDDLDCTVPFYFIEKGIQVRGDWYPIIRMNWVLGDTLDVYVRKIYKNIDKMNSLRLEFRKLANELEQSGIAHGDLQHGNIIVTSTGAMRLVDYDGLFVPALEGKTSLELGHPNYQHPKRTDEQYDTSVDNFSCWLIATALKVIEIDPDLFQQFGFGDESLLFKRSDLADPAQSALFLSLKNHSSPDVRESAKIILRMLWESPEKIPELSATSEELDQLPTSAPETDILSDISFESVSDVGTEYDINSESFGTGGVNDSASSFTTGSNNRSRNKYGFLSNAKRVIGNTTSLIVRQTDSPSWVRYKFHKANTEFSNGNYELALPHYLDVYRFLEGNVYKGDVNYRKSLRRAAYCYGMLGNYNLAHNYFLVAYNASSKVKTPFEKHKTDFLMSISYYSINQKQASFAVFDKSEDILTDLDGIVEGDLERIGYLKNPMILRYFADLLEQKVDIGRDNPWPDNSSQVVLIYRAGMRIHRRMILENSAQIDRTACRMLVDAAAALLAYSKTVNAMDDMDEIDKVLEQIIFLCMRIAKQESLNLEGCSEPLTLDKCFEIAGISAEKSQAFKMLVECSQFEERIKSELPDDEILDELEKLDVSASTMFILKNLPIQTTVNPVRLALAADPLRHPKTYELLLLLAAKKGSVEDHNKLINHIRERIEGKD